MHWFIYSDNYQSLEYKCVPYKVQNEMIVYTVIFYLEMEIVSYTCAHEPFHS